MTPLSSFFKHNPAESRPETNAPADALASLEKEVVLDTTATDNAKRNTLSQTRKQEQSYGNDFAYRSTSAIHVHYRADELVEDDIVLEQQNAQPHTSVSAQDVVRSQEEAMYSATGRPGPSSLSSALAPHGDFADEIVSPMREPGITADRNADSPHDVHKKEGGDYADYQKEASPTGVTAQGSTQSRAETFSEKLPLEPLKYTTALRNQPPKTYGQILRPWNGRLSQDNWFRVAYRPLVLFAYPAILWSTLVYSLSIGWLIVLSESVTTIFRSKDSYNFTPLQAGLVYISPFVGGVLGTAVAGKVSDFIVRYMSRRNGGIYEPEFRLVMGIPIMISTSIGLMGYGWSVQERDNFIVPTIFFGIISFGCSLGSTTAITFAVDSYRQYAGEALVTLNFSKSRFTCKPQHTALPC